MGNNPLFSISLSERAQRELTASSHWYEEQQKELGDRFIEKVLHTLHRIKQNPEAFSTKYKSYREVKIERFPFVIIYRIDKKKKSVFVVSVFHTSQHPRNKY